MTITSEELCKGCPKEFIKFLEYCKNLRFDEEPSYEYLKHLMFRVARKKKFDINDGMFDWEENNNKIITEGS